VSRPRLARIFWIGAAGLLAAAALVGLVAVHRGDFSENDGRILATLAALLYTGGTALAGLALVDRGSARALGWLVAAASPICLAVVLWGLWSFAFDGGAEDAALAAWSAVLVLLAGLVGSTGVLLARNRALVALAYTAGGLAALAAGLSVVGIWTEPEGDTFVKVVAVLWILTALAYFLVPVLQRFTTAGEETSARLLAQLDGVELVASRKPVEGIPVESPKRGERLTLRRIP
jgi:hypothetical protein